MCVCVCVFGFISDSSRDNSQSSTDTASFSGSTQGSCPPSAEKVKLEPVEIVENGICYSSVTSFLLTCAARDAESIFAVDNMIFLLHSCFCSYCHCALCVAVMFWLVSTGVVSNGQIEVPRKKPRKQLL